MRSLKLKLQAESSRSNRTLETPFNRLGSALCAPARVPPPPARHARKRGYI